MEITAQQFRALCKVSNVWLIQLSEHRNEWVAVVRHNPSRQYAVIACSRYVYGESLGPSFKKAMDTFYTNRKSMYGLTLTLW